VATVEEILVPDIGDFAGVEVIEILVQPGDSIQAEQSLLTLESDKATMEIPAPRAGVVKEIKVKIGDKIGVGDLILTLEGSGAVPVTEEPAKAATAPAEQAAEPAPAPAPALVEPQPTTAASPIPIQLPDVGDFQDIPVIEVLVAPGDRVLKNGDVVNIDVTVIKDGYHGDTSRMYFVGESSIAARRLCEVTYDCMWLGIEQVRPGATIGDIGHAIQTHAEKHGYSVVREFCGHGIGRKFHEEPQILHYGKPGTLEKLVAGMTFTVEPMINAGRREIKELADGWTIVTKDHSLSAQWEHTVLVTETGYEVLTRSAATPAPPRFVAAEWTGVTSPEPATA